MKKLISSQLILNCGRSAAPKFNVISKPNNWAKALKKSTSSENKNNISSHKLLQLEFWTSMNEFFNTKSSTINTRSPQPQHWYDLSLGLGQKAYLSLIIHKRERYCSVEVYIPNSKELYFELFDQKDQIESESGVKFEWQELPERQASRIQAKNKDFDLENTGKWQESFEWLFNQIEVIKPIFVKYIKNI